MSNAREKHVVKVVILFVALTGIFCSIADFAKEHAFPIKLVGLLFSIALMWFGREFVFTNFVGLVPAVASKSRIEGTWTIQISFNQDGKTEHRTGSITMSSSLLGVRIKGYQLMNVAENAASMDGWFAENAELISYDNHEILFYLYKIPIASKANSSIEEKFEKIGFACVAREKNAAVFEGTFQDIRVNSRLGKVRDGRIKLLASR